MILHGRRKQENIDGVEKDKEGEVMRLRDGSVPMEHVQKWHGNEENITNGLFIPTFQDFTCGTIHLWELLKIYIM